MARMPKTANRWTPPAARIDGDRLLKAKAAQQRVRDSALQAKAEAQAVEVQAEKSLAAKVDELDDNIDRLMEALPKMIPASGGGRRTMTRLLNSTFISDNNDMSVDGSKIPLRRNIEAWVDAEFATKFVSTKAQLMTALAAGAAVTLAPSLNDMTLTAGEAPTVLENLHLIKADVPTDINFPAGVFTTTTGDIAKVGSANANIRLIGADPVVTTLTSVASISGTSGDFDVVLNLASAAGIAVGDVLKLWNIGPLCLLAGDDIFLERDAPILNELGRPYARIGYVTAADGATSASFDGVGVQTLSDFIAVNDLITMKGETRKVTAVGASSVTVDAAWSHGGVTVSAAYWISKQAFGNTGCTTSGATTTTVQFGAGIAVSQMNAGDLLLVAGQMRRIVSITNSNTIEVSHAINITPTQPCSILTPAVLHEGAHRVTAVSGNQVTVKNRSYSTPPIFTVTGGEVKAIKTVFKNTGTGHGFLFEQNASIYIDQIALQGAFGSTGQTGLAMNGNDPAGQTQKGTTTQLLTGDDVALLEWGRGVFLGHGCTVQSRKMAISGCKEVSVWMMEGSTADFRSAVISGGNSIGIMVLGGATILFTVGRSIGHNGDGIRVLDGGTFYAEIPFFWGCNGMGARLTDNAGFHAAEGVSNCHTGSGLRFEAGKGKIDRMILAGNDREGLEEVYGSHVVAEDAWFTGTTGSAGSGAGIFLANASKCVAGGVTLTGNKKYGCDANDLSELSAPGSYINDNATRDVRARKASKMVLSDGKVGTVEVDEGGDVWVDGVSAAPTLTGVARMNEFAADGAIVRDGTATAVGHAGLRVSGGSAFTFFKVASLVHNFGAIAAGETLSTTVAVSGATVTGMAVVVGSNNVTAGITLWAYVSAADTVTVVAENNSAGSIDPGNATYSVIVIGGS